VVAVSFQVRDHKFKVDGKWYKWNGNKQLTTGKLDGISELKNTFGNALESVQLDYNQLLEDANQKN